MRVAILLLPLLATLCASEPQLHRVNRIYGTYVNNVDAGQRQRILRVHEGQRRRAHNRFEAKPCEPSPALNWSPFYAELAALSVRPVKGASCNGKADAAKIAHDTARFLRENRAYVKHLGGFWTSAKRPGQNVGFTKPDGTPSDIIRDWARQNQVFKAFRKHGSSKVTETCNGKDLMATFFSYIFKYTRNDACGEYRNMITERARLVGCASTVCATQNPAGNGTHALNLICWYDNSINLRHRRTFKSCTGTPPARPKHYFNN